MRAREKVLAIVLAITLVFAAGVITDRCIVSSPGLTKPETVPELGGMEGSSYIIFKEDSTYYAKNEKTENIDYAGTNATQIVENVVDALGSTGGKILFKEGNYPIDVVLDDYTEIEGEGDSTYIQGTISVETSAIRYRNRILRLKVDNIVFQSLKESVIESVYVINHFNLTGTSYDNTIIDVTHATLIHIGYTEGYRANNNYFIGCTASQVIVNATGNVFVGGDFGYLGSGVAFTILNNQNYFYGVRIEVMDVGFSFIAGVHNVVHNPGMHSVKTRYEGSWGNQIIEDEFWKTSFSGMNEVSSQDFIAHELATTPKTVIATPLSQSGNVYITNVIDKNTTHFQVGLWFINGTEVTSGTVRVYWYAEC